MVMVGVLFVVVVKTRNNSFSLALSRSRSSLLRNDSEFSVPQNVGYLYLIRVMTLMQTSSILARA